MCSDDMLSGLVMLSVLLSMQCSHTVLEVIDSGHL